MAFLNQGDIKSINGVTVAQKPTSTQIKDPSRAELGYQAINDSDAGRSLSGLMHVGKVGEKLTLDLGWNAITPDQVKVIATAVKAKSYFPVVYYDAEAGDYVTKTFYLGDRKASFIQFWIGGERFEYGFQLIER